jgi:hypothetical protein
MRASSTRSTQLICLLRHSWVRRACAESRLRCSNAMHATGGKRRCCSAARTACSTAGALWATVGTRAAGARARSCASQAPGRSVPARRAYRCCTAPCFRTDFSRSSRTSSHRPCGRRASLRVGHRALLQHRLLALQPHLLAQALRARSRAVCAGCAPPRAPAVLQCTKLCLFFGGETCVRKAWLCGQSRLCGRGVHRAASVGRAYKHAGRGAGAGGARADSAPCTQSRTTANSAWSLALRSRSKASQKSASTSPAARGQ